MGGGRGGKEKRNSPDGGGGSPLAEAAGLGPPESQPGLATDLARPKARRAKIAAGELGRFPEYHGHPTSPDGVVGGSKDMDSAAAWSRDDLVPVGFIGYRIDY